MCRGFPLDGFTRGGARTRDARTMMEKPDCVASSVTCHPCGWARRVWLEGCRTDESAGLRAGEGVERAGWR
jgi:hypothetical protein